MFFGRKTNLAFAALLIVGLGAQGVLVLGDDVEEKEMGGRVSGHTTERTSDDSFTPPPEPCVTASSDNVFTGHNSFGEPDRLYTFDDIENGNWPWVDIYGGLRLLTKMTTDKARHQALLLLGSPDSPSTDAYIIGYSDENNGQPDKWSWSINGAGVIQSQGGLLLSSPWRVSSHGPGHPLKKAAPFEIVSTGAGVPLYFMGLRNDVRGPTLQLNYNGGLGDPTTYPLLCGRDEGCVDFAIGREGALWWGDANITTLAPLNAGPGYAKLPGFAATDTTIQMDTRLFRSGPKRMRIDSGTLGGATLEVDGSVRAIHGGTFSQDSGHEDFAPSGFPMPFVLDRRDPTSLNALGGQVYFFEVNGNPTSLTFGIPMVREGSITAISFVGKVSAISQPGSFSLRTHVNGLASLIGSSGPIQSIGVHRRQIYADRGQFTFEAGDQLAFAIGENTFVGVVENLRVVVEVVYGH